MDVLEAVAETQKRCEQLRLSGRTIALVPTMGFFHEAHLELMRVAKRHADTVVISLFVNPMQFRPDEDFRDYPRDLEGDLAKARSVGVDLAFVPSPEEMYPSGFQAKVDILRLSQHLCGKSRPGHFVGVATVVLKLFNIIRPHLAIFGQKDYQQLAVISRMVKDLNLDLQIVGVPTIRDPDGLAMSSRNAYLSTDERVSARSLKDALDLVRNMVGQGERDTERIKKRIATFIHDHLVTEIEYITLCDPVTLEDVETIEGETLLALAVKIGKARLIDNCIISDPAKEC
jgi:pantoate--beta-alanine ligase